MKKISTLVCIALCTLFTNRSSAQFNENFDGGLAPLTSNCWTILDLHWTTDPTWVINGTGSVYSNPPTSGAVRELTTPALNCTSTSLTIGFNYKTSNPINGNATRTIEVGIIGTDNNFTSLYLLTLDRFSPSGVQAFNQAFTIPTGVKKVMLRLSGSGGDGNARLIVDDLYTSASPLYASNCNSAPIAVDDVFTGLIGAVITGNVMTNDNEPNGENMAPTMVATSPDGTVVLNIDGSFTFTPNVGFIGTTTSFTYQLTDDGFSPMISNVATVTINLTNPTVLAVKLSSFQGNLNNNKVTLQWTVADNETASQFEVERSTDGKNFSSAAVVFSTSKSGNESYLYWENNEAAKSYYRLKMTDKAGEVTYSKILIFQTKSVSDNGVRIISNPVNDKLTLSFDAQANQVIDIRVIDMAGRILIQQKLNAYKGSNMVSISLDSFMKGGMYIVDLTDGTTHAIAKFVKQ